MSSKPWANNFKLNRNRMYTTFSSARSWRFISAFHLTLFRPCHGGGLWTSFQLRLPQTNLVWPVIVYKSCVSMGTTFWKVFPMLNLLVKNIWYLLWLLFFADSKRLKNPFWSRGLKKFNELRGKYQNHSAKLFWTFWIWIFWTLNGVLFLHSKRRKLCSLMKEHSDAFAGLAERKHTFVNVQHEERLWQN